MTMPHYFFHVQFGDEIVEDEDGEDLPGIEEAHERAVRSAKEIVANAIKSGLAAPDAIIIAPQGGDSITLPMVSIIPKNLRT